MSDYYTEEAEYFRQKIEFEKSFEDTYGVTFDRLRELVKADAEGRNPQPAWIRCSEGLPKCPTRKEIKRDWYIVTLQTGIVSLRAFEFDEKSPFGYGFHEQNIIPVVAWQPLPAPYQGGEMTWTS